MPACPFPLEYFPALKYVQYNDAGLEWPMHMVKFENDWEETRAGASSQRPDEFSITVRCDEVEFQLVIDFLLAHMLGVCPFYFTHPLYGTGIVKYASSKLPVKFMIQGNPIWYEATLTFRPQR